MRRRVLFVRCRLLVIAAQTGAAGFPERNITVIVPFPAGGASDMAVTC